MNKATSLYLDGVRLLAAFMVFADHTSGSAITGGLFWQFAPYGAEAVTVFFVLSGYVIMHATASRETSLASYVLARASRIYSVVIPALILTCIVDFIGRHADSPLYSTAMHYSDSYLRVLGSIIFANQLWWLDFDPGSDWSFWSLGYEVWYYALFGAAFFLRGRRRILAVGALAILVGPPILALLPLWALGALCYRVRLPKMAAAVLFVLSLAAWAAYETLAWHYGRPFIDAKRPQLIQDYIVGLCFAANLAGFRSMSEGWTPGSWRLLRWFAGGTFSLYLYHEPIARALASISPWVPASWPNRLLVDGGTLAAVYALAQITERRKDVLRNAISRSASFGRRIGPHRLPASSSSTVTISPSGSSTLPST